MEVKNKKIKEFKVACIFDDFTKTCYEGIVDTIAITPDNWKEKIVENSPDIFFMESVWHGEKNSWENKILYNKVNENSILKEIITCCNNKKIPTIFWNKEDPLHYDKFINCAKLFDYVFTTDENSIEKYKKDLGHERVYTLPFAANPQIHNPIKFTNEKKNKSFFAGTYYRVKCEQRRRDLKNLLDLAIKYTNLDIYDRHYNLNNIIYKFPDKYHPYIKGYLDIDDMYKTYKKYRIALNVNLIKDSPTMFSRRVFECLASGVPVISSYSLGINKLFREIVVASDDINELEEEFIKLEDEKYYYSKALRGIREVINKHTYINRLIFILNKVGIPVITEYIKLAVVSIIEDLNEYKTLKEKYLTQTYKYKKLYVFTTNNNLPKDVDEEDEIQIILLNKNNLNEKVQLIFKEDYIGYVNINNIYGSFYFEDLINARLYSKSDIIGKKSFYKLENNQEKLINEDMDFRYVEDIDFDKCIIKKEILSEKSINDILEYVNHNNLYDINSRIFSSDKSNLIIF